MACLDGSALIHLSDGQGSPQMPRHGTVIFGDLKDNLEVLQVACTKCVRRGQYPLPG